MMVPQQKADMGNNSNLENIAKRDFPIEQALSIWKAEAELVTCPNDLEELIWQKSREVMPMNSQSDISNAVTSRKEKTTTLSRVVDDVRLALRDCLTLAHWPVAAASLVAYFVVSWSFLEPSEFTPFAARSQPTQNEHDSPYVALVSDTELAAETELEVVRGQLPNTVLASLGAPVDLEQVNEYTKAETLVNRRGKLLAVRFVK